MCVHARASPTPLCSRGSAVQGQAGKSSVHVASTLLLLSCVNGLALVLKNLGFVVSFGGALLGSALVYIFPALMFVRATQQKAASLKAQGKGAEPPRAHEAPLAQSISTSPSAHAALGVRHAMCRQGAARGAQDRDVGQRRAGHPRRVPLLRGLPAVPQGSGPLRGGGGLAPLRVRDAPVGEGARASDVARVVRARGGRGGRAARAGMWGVRARA